MGHRSPHDRRKFTPTIMTNVNKMGMMIVIDSETEISDRFTRYLAAVFTLR